MDKHNLLLLVYLRHLLINSCFQFCFVLVIFFEGHFFFFQQSKKNNNKKPALQLNNLNRNTSGSCHISNTPSSFKSAIPQDSNGALIFERTTKKKLFLLFFSKINKYKCFWHTIRRNNHARSEFCWRNNKSIFRRIN